MKVTLRTVTGTTFALDLEDSSKVNASRFPAPLIIAIVGTSHLRYGDLIGCRCQSESPSRERRRFPCSQSSLDLPGQGELQNDTAEIESSLIRARTRVQVLKDDTTLADNKVSENGFMVVMVSKVSCFIPCHG